ncbi:LapA family protein [Mangrovicoccus sp. HB161399]|uniref:LapA family protein n=1 Tax=Mangrovicoccus sp. HB161399 TaxID=2720392 RepID=UPI001554E5D7|nr:LapA family protein [Mangrovicoccus sp. HB161399]
MRYVKIVIAVIIAIPLITIFYANRQIVELVILPETLERFIGLNAIMGPIAVPLWAVAIGFLALGLVLGFFWEWFREHKHRHEAAKGRQSKAELQAEVKKMKARQNAGKDPVLVMVEETAPAR